MAQSIFTSQTPSLTDANDSTRYTLCTLFTPAVNGQVTHGRWYFPATAPSRAPVFALFQRTSDAAGVQLGLTATFSLAGYAPGWRTVALPAAVDITAGTYYYAAVKTEDRYVASSGFFTGSSVVNGDLTAPADDTGTPRRNGRFNDFGLQDIPDYPDSGGGASYFADVVFEPAPATATAVLAAVLPVVTASLTGTARAQATLAGALPSVVAHFAQATTVVPGTLTPGAAAPAILVPGAATAARLEAR